MFIIDVIPLIRLPKHLPQIFSFFSLKEIQKGVVVIIKIRNKETPALAINCENARNRRIEIKRKDFEMKPIAKIISSIPVLTANQIQLGFWMAEYYLEPISFVFQTIAPKSLKKITKTITLETGEIFDISLIKKMILPKPLFLQSENIDKAISYLKPEITNAIFQNRQVLVIAPETIMIKKIFNLIALDFPNEEIHDLNEKQNSEKTWKKYSRIKNNQIKIIIGTRSGVFAPFANLGLIIIIDENNTTHKQWAGHPLYDARDIAEKLSKIFDAKIIKEGETLSIVSQYKVMTEKYDYKLLTSKNSTKLPKIIDMRLEQRKGNFSPLSEFFVVKIQEIIKNKKKAIFFINRRGAANFIICKNCGDLALCPICKIPLIYYPEIKSFDNKTIFERLICNHCNFSCQPQNICAKCHGVQIKYTGLGTQKIERQLKRDFPHLHIFRLDSDIAKNNKTKKQILDSFSKTTPSVLVATQQVFSLESISNISFIGVISLDAMLAIPDYQSSERIYFIIKKLIAISDDLAIQTYDPANSFLKFLVNMDYNALYKQEIEDRQLFFYPPFSKIIKFNYRHLIPQKAKSEALIFFKSLQSALNEEILKKEIKLLGPAPRFIFQEKGFYNWHIILKIKDQNEILSQVKNKIKTIIPKNWETDVNPDHLL